MMPGRAFLPLLAVIASGASPVPVPPPAVVTVPGVEAYRQTVQGIRDIFPDAAVLDVHDAARLRDHLNRYPAGLVISIGTDSALLIEQLAGEHAVLIHSVIFESDLDRRAPGRSRARASITVDLPPAMLFRQLKRVFPGKTRIGVIRGPMQTASYMAALAESARKNSYLLSVIDCSDPKELVSAFLRFKSSVDFVWCPPSAQLYTSATLKPLLIASITNQLPIIGFSEQFVQAGALFGGMPDFREIGRQTAVIAQRLFRGETVDARDDARTFRFAYNQRVARLLGVKAAAETGGELIVLR